MSRVKRLVAAVLTGVMMSGVLAVSAMATPDEWISGRGPYLDTAEKEAHGQPGRLANAGAAGRYVVRKGDTLLAIAGRLGIPVGELASMNNLGDPNLIRGGQVLLVPGSVYFHTVLPGETLSGIAKNSGVPVKEIAAANGLSNEDLLFPGQKLLIAQGSGSAGSPPAEAVSRSLPVGELEWPVVGWISSPYGMREGRLHEGVDIAADHGDPIRAAMPGRVTFSGPRGGYGLAVIIDHGEGLCTLYAHASKIIVSEGQWVDRGEVIALVGNTGKSRGPHLHMELHINGVPYDPLICFNRLRA